MEAYRTEWSLYYKEYLDHMWLLWNRNIYLHKFNLSQEDLEEWVFDHSFHEGMREEAPRASLLKTTDAILLQQLYLEYQNLKSYCHGAVIPLLNKPSSHDLNDLLDLML